MRETVLAEWILALTVPPDRAATTVGDLMEVARTRGPLWFWSSVVRTASRHFLQALCASPLRMFDLAVLGWLSEMFPLGVPLGFAWLSALFLSVALRGATPTLAACAAVVGFVVIPFFAGRKTASRVPGQELPAAFAQSLLGTTIWILVLYLAAIHVPTSVIVMLCARSVFVMAGAIWFRSRMRHA
jgi:hypothetical protein